MLAFLINSVAWILTVLTGAFVFWRRMRTEIDEDKLWLTIISLTSVCLFLGRTGNWLLQIFEPGWNYQWWWQFRAHPGFEIWTGLLGCVLVLKFSKSIPKTLWREAGDALIEAYVWGIVIIWTVGSVNKWLRENRIFHWWEVMTIIILLGIWYWLRQTYRKFSWYPSGKAGFSWWTGLAFLAIGDIMIQSQYQSLFFNPRVIYNLIVILTSGVGIYMLSGRRIIDDWYNVLNKFKLLIVTAKQRVRRRF